MRVGVPAVRRMQSNTFYYWTKSVTSNLLVSMIRRRLWCSGKQNHNRIKQSNNVPDIWNINMEADNRMLLQIIECYCLFFANAKNKQFIHSLECTLYISNFDVMTEQGVFENLAGDITWHHTCHSYLKYFIQTTSSPFLWNSLCHSATFPWCVDDLDIIWGKLNQISQGTGLDDGRVSDKVLLKIHRLHRLCEGNLQGNEEEGGDTEL